MNKSQYAKFGIDECWLLSTSPQLILTKKTYIDRNHYQPGNS